MIVGFTGTREGMSKRQLTALRFALMKYRDMITEFHHGDCVGADAEAHDIAVEILGVNAVYIHPPTDPKHRAFKQSSHIFEPLPYLQRDYVIVDQSTILIGAPKRDDEERCSGTWTTIRYARNTSTPVLQLYR